MLDPRLIPFTALVRYLPNGRLDPQFGNHGTVLHRFGRYGGRLGALAIQPDGKIVAVGGIDEQVATVRYASDGRLDPSFGDGGKVATPFGHYGESASAVAVQRDGKILIGGGLYTSPNDMSPNVLVLARLTSDGHLDRTFGTGGKIVDKSRGAVAGITVQPGGRVIVLARPGPAWTDSPPSLALLAYMPNGRPDLGFGS